MPGIIRRTFSGLGAAAAVLAGLAGFQGFHIGAAEPPVVEAPKEPMRVVLLADVKDHGPAGNGVHDYPLWQKRWAALLGGQGAPHVEVTTARHWPSEKQFKTADVIVAYCYLERTGERLARLRRYLEDGGGLALIHSATWTKPKPSPEVAEVFGVGGFQLFRHGPVRLDIVAADHPICAGLPETIVLEDDETYWPPTPMKDEITVLATSIEEKGKRGSTPRAAQAMCWCYQVGEGRVFGCVPGHRIETFDDPMFQTLLLRGIAWAAGEQPSRLDTSTSAGKGSGEK